METQHRVVGQKGRMNLATTSINKRRRNTRYGTPHISDLPVGFLVDLSAYLSQPSTRAYYLLLQWVHHHHHLHGSWAEGWCWCLMCQWINCNINHPRPLRPSYHWCQWIATSTIRDLSSHHITIFTMDNGIQRIFCSKDNCVQTFAVNKYWYALLFLCQSVKRIHR